jgi:ammonia channel protein AmtB
VDAVVGLRVDEEDEATGLDLSLHAETAYTSSGAGERPTHL